MSQTHKTVAQLIAELPDNTTRLLSPQDMRDLVVSLSPFVASRDPGPNDDAFNSGGTGAFFDQSQYWWNQAFNRLFLCVTGTLHAAVWLPIATQQQWGLNVWGVYQYVPGSWIAQSGGLLASHVPASGVLDVTMPPPGLSNPYLVMSGIAAFGLTAVTESQCLSNTVFRISTYRTLTNALTDPVAVWFAAVGYPP